MIFDRKLCKRPELDLLCKILLFWSWCTTDRRWSVSCVVGTRACASCAAWCAYICARDLEDGSFFGLIFARTGRSCLKAFDSVLTWSDVRRWLSRFFSWSRFLHDAEDLHLVWNARKIMHSAIKWLCEDLLNDPSRHAVWIEENPFVSWLSRR